MVDAFEKRPMRIYNARHCNWFPQDQIFFHQTMGPTHRMRKGASRQTRHKGAWGRSKAIDRHLGGQEGKRSRASASPRRFVPFVRPDISTLLLFSADGMEPSADDGRSSDTQTPSAKGIRE
jgi:hypothetical protein